MIAERNDPPSRLEVTFQRPHDGRMYWQDPLRTELRLRDHYRARPRVEVDELQLAHLSRAKTRAERQPDHCFKCL
jgi:hypothetical protein